MRGKKYNRGGQGSKGYGKTNKQDAMTMALEDSKTDSPNSVPNKDKMKAAFVAATAGLGAGSSNSISKQDEEFLEDYNMGGTMNYDVGGTAEEHKAAKTSSATQEVTRKQFKKALKDLTEAVDEDNKKSKQYLKDNLTTPIKINATRLLTKVLGKSKEIVTGERGPGSGKSSNPQRPSSTRNMGGTMKNYRAGGIEAADKEGSRLSISMERQEDAGYSPSEADFDKQHTLAAEGIMEVGADVTTIQGHNSRASLGETEGVRGTGAMVKGTKFRGSF